MDENTIKQQKPEREFLEKHGFYRHFPSDYHQHVKQNVEKPNDCTSPPKQENIYIGLEVAEERGSPLNKQVGGDHYKKLKIQPVEYNHANNLDFFQGNVVKYITRFRDKNGKADLEKAKHIIELLIELEYGKTTHTKD